MTTDPHARSALSRRHLLAASALMPILMTVEQAQA